MSMLQDNDVLESLRRGPIPQHVAVIMDGNGRWATARGLARLAGHRAGVETIEDILIHVKLLGIRYFTIYAFSTENWKRPQDEVEGLMKLFVEFIDRKIDRLHAEGVYVRTIGDMSRLPQAVQEKMRHAEAVTRGNDAVTLNIALNYGGRQELLRACRSLAQEVADGQIAVDDIDDEVFSAHLYTAGQPDPDLLIRTSGELRISNFLLWQIAYSEIWVTDTYWPDFTKEDLFEGIRIFQKRDRRYGGLSK